MSKIETNTIDNISGSSTLTIGDSNTSTITLKSGATLTNFPSNTPIVLARCSTTTSCSDGTATKITLDNELIDTDNLFASSRFTVTSGYEGKYLVHWRLSFNHTANEKYALSLISLLMFEVLITQLYFVNNFSILIQCEH